MNAAATGSESSPKVESNRALAKHFLAEQDRVRGGPVESVCAPNYQATIGGNGPMDRAGHEAFATAFYASFPDARHDIEEIIAIEDRMAVRFIITGTNTASLLGMPATGRQMRVAANALLHVEDGRVTTFKAVFDEAGMLRQLGVLEV